MDIGGASGSGAQLGLQLQAAILRKSKEVQEVQGQAAVKLIEQTSDVAAQTRAASSAHPRVGSTLDIYA